MQAIEKHTCIYELRILKKNAKSSFLIDEIRKPSHTNLNLVFLKKYCLTFLICMSISKFFENYARNINVVCMYATDICAPSSHKNIQIIGYNITTFKRPAIDKDLIPYDENSTLFYKLTIINYTNTVVCLIKL